ncbi:MAG: hypothetical protein UX71_C0001G0081 [Parcubacteria group bacterium GW2011_GWA1_47_10]|uniref:DNA recombination protein RmuC n=1 Tax=Candidatus Gottesmanbacteria bacterium GW2011_GWA2_47_9 TaxID=1618445 RepID=A0A0G1TZF4_9BACT|nr:MAG: hypothetical protein UX71_C0001G0081 [Parcubacteria group bacterium GW2011_GWA1_47_10]KKU87164.1 MAG: hypothetical protein UY16_C0036G0006 [Candidatus Gottesmanbacteria bacterium GW2011_GWA2_47_9]KKU97668.1 MAG: hypothetical protein UY30_C0001G0014 [Parcubacteria group bacterium GW2011_GWB1_48_6]
MEIEFLLIGVVLGAVIAWFVAKSKFLNKEAISVEEHIKITSQLASKETELHELQSRYSEEKEKDNKFENIAEKILTAQSKALMVDNKTHLQETLNPLKDKITEFQNKAETIHRENLKETTILKEQIGLFSKLNEQMSKDATNLTKALKGETKTQGGWGEMILESVLEKSGLIKNIHFRTQESMTSEGGRRLQPDVIINLPENKHIVIDSKVSLVAYDKFWATENESEKVVLLKEHINSVRNHVKELSKKNYQSLYQINAPDFVLMFIPIEPAYLLALNNDLELWAFAYEYNVIILGPTNLIPTLRLINNLWKTQSQNVNALEIARQSGELYDKFVGFITDLVDIGKKIDSAKENYEEAIKKISTGKGNLLNRVENIKKLGAKSTKAIPSVLLEGSKEVE